MMYKLSRAYMRKPRYSTPEGAGFGVCSKGKLGVGGGGGALN